MSGIEEDMMVDTADMFDKENMINGLLDIGEVATKEISLTSKYDNGIGQGNTNIDNINGLSDVMETKGMNDSLVDSRDISDTTEVVESEVMERRNAVKSLSLFSQNKKCLLESPL